MSPNPISVPKLSGIYIPVHRRTPSDTSSIRSGSSSISSYSASSSRATSPASSVRSAYPHTLAHENTQSKTESNTPTHPYMYSRDTLLALSKSPLARMSSETREQIRTALPEVVMNRKMRKALEYHAAQEERSHGRTQHAQKQHQSQKHHLPHQHQQSQHPQQHSAEKQAKLPRQVAPAPHRHRPAGRTPEGRHNALKLVEGASWRGMRAAVSAM